MRTSSSVDSGGTERLPHDRLADVRRDEERDARTQTVALLQQFVEQQHNETGYEELQGNAFMHG